MTTAIETSREIRVKSQIIVQWPIARYIFLHNGKTRIRLCITLTLMPKWPTKVLNSSVPWSSTSKFLTPFAPAFQSKYFTIFLVVISSVILMCTVNLTCYPALVCITSEEAKIYELIANHISVFLSILYNPTSLIRPRDYVIKVPHIAKT